MLIDQDNEKPCASYTKTKVNCINMMMEIFYFLEKIDERD